MEKTTLKLVEFLPGQPVYDKRNKSFGIVLDNYGDPVFGDGGEVRLDSDGNQGLFEYDKDWNRIGYNLVRLQDMTEKETLAAVAEAEQNHGLLITR